MCPQGGVVSFEVCVCVCVCSRHSVRAQLAKRLHLFSVLDLERPQIADIVEVRAIIDKSCVCRNLLLTLAVAVVPSLLIFDVLVRVDMPLLLEITSHILDRIMDSVVEIPHGIRWLCKSLVQFCGLP